MSALTEDDVRRIVREEIGSVPNSSDSVRDSVERLDRAVGVLQLRHNVSEGEDRVHEVGDEGVEVRDPLGQGLVAGVEHGCCDACSRCEFLERGGREVHGSSLSVGAGTATVGESTPGTSAPSGGVPGAPPS